jgi:hypothetical protein
MRRRREPLLSLFGKEGAFYFAAQGTRLPFGDAAEHQGLKPIGLCSN